MSLPELSYGRKPVMSTAPLFPLLGSVVLCSMHYSVVHAADELPEMVVTATRTANTLDETLAPVSIITREEIERRQIKSVPEALASVPGVDVVKNGGYGSLSNVYLRGTNSDHVLTLIDGVKVGSATSGTLSFEYLPIEQIERIEVVRGPRASLYGADAIGGVIQIFTRKGKQGQPLAGITGGGGNQKTGRLNAFVQGADQQKSWHLGISGFTTGGYNFVGDTTGKDHGYNNLSFSANGRYRLSDGNQLSALFLRTQGNAEYDGSFVNNTDFSEQVAAVDWRYQASNNWNSMVKLNNHQSRQDNLLNSSKMSFFNTSRNSISWQNDISIRDQDLLTLGLEYLNEQVDSQTAFTTDSRYNYAAFGQYQYFGNNFDVLLALRNDENQAYGNYTTGNLAVGSNITDNWRLTGSYGSAFKAPTFNDLYYPLEIYPPYTPGGASSSYSGNPDLQAETSQSLDLGVQWQLATQQLSIHYFYTRIDNLISFVTDYNATENRYDGTMKNIDKAVINGVELGWQVSLLSHWQIQANYTWLDPRNRDSDKLLPNRSRHLFNLGLHQTRGKLTYGTTVQAASSRYIDTLQNYRLAGFAIANIQLGWTINRQWRINGSIDNLFDKQYATSARYGLSQKYLAPGRLFMLTLSYQQY